MEDGRTSAVDTVEDDALGAVGWVDAQDREGRRICAPNVLSAREEVTPWDGRLKAWGLW